MLTFEKVDEPEALVQLNTALHQSPAQHRSLVQGFHAFYETPPSSTHCTFINTAALQTATPFCNWLPQLWL
ncbi:hypothetical protein HPB50_019693 [Hyalomma asiaticum]|uniref:Uncharacterized protein n=1 Tax=Hyalomma asiaticum TaxID=266040 RepID=A0ACB7S8F7_HYAAI|nr:hypothetical protein HPB50_019693 [Hyalomma asiaticum]